MNTKLTIRTKSELKSVKFADLAIIYNEFAEELGLNTIKKFNDKAQGVKRILDIQVKYAEEIVASKRETRFNLDQIVSYTDKCNPKEGTIEYSLKQSILENEEEEGAGATVDQIIDWVVTNHERPRSYIDVTEKYVVHNIKWFVKKGHLILEELEEF